jgi:hypothetical protein
VTTWRQRHRGRRLSAVTLVNIYWRGRIFLSWDWPRLYWEISR